MYSRCSETGIGVREEGNEHQYDRLVARMEVGPVSAPEEGSKDGPAGQGDV